MEQDPTPHYHDECPNCGFELDLSPPEAPRLVHALGLLATNERETMTNKQRIQKAREEAIKNAESPESGKFQAEVATFVEMRKIARANVLIRQIDKARALQA